MAPDATARHARASSGRVRAKSATRGRLIASATTPSTARFDRREVGVGVVQDPVVQRADPLALAPAAEAAAAEMPQDGLRDVEDAPARAEAQQQVGVLEPEPEALVEAADGLELGTRDDQRRRRRLGDRLDARVVDLSTVVATADGVARPALLDAEQDHEEVGQRRERPRAVGELCDQGLRVHEPPAGGDRARVLLQRLQKGRDRARLHQDVRVQEQHVGGLAGSDAAVVRRREALGMRPAPRRWLCRRASLGRLPYRR